MKRRAATRGFTYLGLVILLAVMGMVAAAGLKMGTLLQRAVSCHHSEYGLPARLLPGAPLRIE